MNALKMTANQIEALLHKLDLGGRRRAVGRAGRQLVLRRRVNDVENGNNFVRRIVPVLRAPIGNPNETTRCAC